MAAKTALLAIKPLFTPELMEEAKEVEYEVVIYEVNYVSAMIYDC